MCLYKCAFLLVERTACCTEVTQLVGLDAVEMQTQLVGEKLAGIRNHSKDAYATRKCGFLSKNLVCSAAYVIAAAGSHTAHGNNYGLLLGKECYLVPDLFACVCASAR